MPGNNSAIKNQSFKEAASKKMMARYLIVVKGYTQKEVSGLIDVSEKTISVWSKKYKWKEILEEDEIQKIGGGLSTLMDGFIDYVKKHAPGISRDVKALWESYLKSVKGE